MEIVLRATAIYFFLFALTRGMGKRELSEMTAFELLLLVTVGDLVQQGVTEEDMSVTGAMLGVGTIGLWIVAGAWVSFRWKGARRLVEGVPVIVVKDGLPVMEALRIERVTLEEVLEAARQQGIENLRDVKLAVLEPDGRFSLIKRGPSTEPTAPPEHHRA
jgi:uncharacterized membrane protein YcaP (DUF421 family)